MLDASISHALVEPPWPQDPAEFRRWRFTRRTRRLLYGAWDADLRERMSQALGAVRREAWRVADRSANVLRSAAQQVSVAYDRAPSVTVDGDRGAADAAAAAGLWSLMQRVQRDTWGLREMYLGLDVADGVPVIRPVYPDMVLSEAAPEDPSTPVIVREAVLRDLGEGRPSEWTWDVWDVSDPEHPSVTIWDARMQSRISHLALRRADGSPAPPDGLVGDEYDRRLSDGTPILPYSLRHAALTGALHDPYELDGLVEGTLNLAVYWSMFGHVLRQSSWAQRYGLNVEMPSGPAGSGATTRASVVTDPATVAMFQRSESSDAGDPALLGQFEPPVDPEKFIAAVLLYHRMLAGAAGINESDVQRVAGDPRSGFALAISREGQREAQRRMEPVLRMADSDLLARIAALMNRANGTSYPESGYRITYEAVPLSAEERRAQREDILGLVDAGLLDRVSAYQQLHPGLTEADAAEALGRIAEINARYRGSA